MLEEVQVGRPPLSEDRKRKNRRVALFTDGEIDEINAYLEANAMGINDLIRELVLREIRDKLGYPGLEES